MRLISKAEYDAIYLPNKSLIIENYEERNHAGTHYYFRLGAVIDAGYPIPVTAETPLPPHGFLRVLSYEVFHLSEHVMGDLGNASTVIEQGFELIHGLSLDPGFNGILELSIRNYQPDTPLRLRPRMVIGKVRFYDVSDTVVNVDDFRSNPLVRDELVRRDETARRLLDSAFEEAPDLGPDESTLE